MRKKNDAIRSAEKAIGYVFTDKALLTRALTHRSFLNENQNEEHNERIEFLGDAVLQLVTTEKLFARYPDEPEGILSAYRSLIVKTEFLIDRAKDLNLREHIRVSAGQKKDMQKNSVALLADAVEAIIGAIYLDGGFAPAERFIQDKVLVDMEKHLERVPLQDPKTALQERAQRETGITPEYTTLKDSGPDHDKTFTVSVKVGKKQLAKATGKSKQDAEQNAAKKALESGMAG